MDIDKDTAPINSNTPLNQFEKGNQQQDPHGVGILISQDMILPSAIKPRHLAKSLTQAEGDTYAVDSNGSFAKLPIGTTGQVLTVASGTTSWATPTPSTQIPTVTALTGTTPTMTCTGTNNIIFTITLSGNTTYSITGATAGQILMVEVKQGSGTTYTNTWFSTVTWVIPGAAAPIETTTSNGYTTYGFRVLTSSTFLGYLVATN